MTCHWETSQKPLTIKTIWVGGHRHAILSQADCGATRRNSREIKITHSKPHDEPEVPFFKLAIHRHSISRLSPGKEAKTLRHLHEKNEECDDGNPLSERVLQWLDLAGQENFKLNIDECKRTDYLNIRINDQNTLIKNDNQNVQFNKNFSLHWGDDGNVKLNKISKDLIESEDEAVVKLDEQSKVKSDYYRLKNFEINEDVFYERLNVRTKRKKLHIFIPSPSKIDLE